MNKIMVTGGAGFLGANLCEFLIRDTNNYVYAVDNLLTGRMKNLLICQQYKNFQFINADVTSPIDIEVDQIYNAACPASPLAYQKSPTYTTKICVLGIINMLELAKKYGATLLQFSTSEIYGEPQVHPQVESYYGNVNISGIRSCYDEGKRLAESLCYDYNREFGTKVKVVRIFNTYGKYMNPKDGRVISNLIMQALRGEDLTIYGNGSQTRSFQYVDDLIEGIVCMMNESRSDFLGPVNLGNPEEFTIQELADMIIEKTQSNSQMVYSSLPMDDPTHRKPSIDVAKKELNGWTPKIKLSEGLDRSIEYFKQYIK